MHDDKNSVERFSDRVENYARYRPNYPQEVLLLLQNECGLRPDHKVADIGFGTGIFTQLLLEKGASVIGVEPNEAMRREGERLLSRFEKFQSVNGTAEATTIPNASVDFITAAQAAHWFDREASRREFQRVLKPGGWIVLLWNERLTNSTPFLIAYEQLLLEYATDYSRVRHEHATNTIGEFFAPLAYSAFTYSMNQAFDYAGLEGRLLSSSYAPGPNHPRHAEMLKALRELFDTFEENGQVTIDYVTRVYTQRIENNDQG